MREVVLVPTYQRDHYLACCLKRIRAQDSTIPIMIFGDHGSAGPDFRNLAFDSGATVHLAQEHKFYGNSYNVMRALSIVYRLGYDLVHYCEDDAMMHPDCLAWHRDVHADVPNIFASCGWVGNQHAPIEPDLGLLPWIYTPNYSIKREKLALVVKHAVPEYYNAPRDYVLKTWPNSILHNKGAQSLTQFWEQDAVLQYCLMEDKSQVAWRGTALVDHVGISGYNRPSGPVFEGTLDERVTKVESLIADPHWRSEIFGRAIVEREIGHKLGRREYVYTIKLPGGWESEFVSELKPEQLPRRLNSVPMPRDALITGTLRQNG